jgi:hypothetical protein
MYRDKSIAPTAMSLDEDRPIRPRELSLNTKTMLLLVLLMGNHPREPAEDEVLAEVA